MASDASSARSRRLEIEKTLLTTAFGDYLSWDGKSNVAVLWTYVSGRRYVLRMEGIDSFPDALPSTFLQEPCPLTRHDGSKVEGVSGPWHTLGNSAKGEVKICTYMFSCWNSATTLLKIFAKAAIWCAAFDCHKQTGKPLDKYLTEMSEQSQRTDYAKPSK